MTTPMPPGYQNGFQIPQQSYGPPPQGFGPQGFRPQGFRPQGYGPPPQGFGPAAQGYGQGAPVPPRKPWYARKVFLIPVLVVAVLVVLGIVFGSSSGMNVESALQKALSGRPGITSVSDVSCPSSVDTHQGSNATCQATVNGQRSNLTLSFDRDDHFVVTDAQPVG